jgi:hypothetical protein
MTQSDNTLSQERILLAPIPPEGVELTRRFDVLYEKVLSILREADINANYLMTRFDYDLEAFIIVLDLDRTHSQTEVESLIQDAFSERFGDVMRAGEQERLRVQYAAYHIWNAWVAYQEKNDPTLSTRAGTLLAYRKDRQGNPEGIRGW